MIDLFSEICPTTKVSCDDCLFCSGEACNFCGAGLWDDWEREPCHHDIIERHDGYTE